MTAINISARVRFTLYVIAAVALPTVNYVIDKGWAGEAEFTLVTTLAALLSTLAASKTDLSEPNTRPVRPVQPPATDTAIMAEPGDMYYENPDVTYYENH